jgi:hypothetical protein
MAAAQNSSSSCLLIALINELINQKTLIFYTAKKYYFYDSSIAEIHYIVSCLEVSLISQQPYKLAHMPCCSYLLRDTKVHGFIVGCRQTA